MMKADQLAEVLRLHVLWGSGDPSGVRADLAAADLIAADLAAADLAGANLCGANLAGANLTGANLYDANLAGANLIDAILLGATMTDANLISAALTDANLTCADLAGAKLPYATMTGTGYQSLRVLEYHGYVVPQRLQIGCVLFGPAETQALLGPDPEATFCAMHVQATPEVWRVFGPAIQGAIRSSMLEVPERWEGGR